MLMLHSRPSKKYDLTFAHAMRTLMLTAVMQYDEECSEVALYRQKQVSDPFLRQGTVMHEFIADAGAVWR